MRDRKIIEQDVMHLTDRYVLLAQLEVLLDIRDLLNHKNTIGGKE